MSLFPLESPAAVLAGLVGIAAFFFWLEKATQWRLFTYLPPLLFIYLVPLIVSNAGILPTASPVYKQISSLVLPMMLVLMLLNLDVGAAFRSLGRGLVVMLFGSVGVMVGAVASILLVGHQLSPTAWKAYGSLAGSWTGGTGNLISVAQMFDAKDEMGLAILADTIVYAVWLPILLVSKKFTDQFARFTGVSAERSASIRKSAAAIEHASDRKPKYQDYLYLLAIALAVTAAVELPSVKLSAAIDSVLTPPAAVESAASAIPHEPILSSGTLRVLLATTIAIGLSFTPLRRIAGSHELAMAFLFIFVAQTGASAQLEKVKDQAPWFVLGAFAWIFIHGLFCLLGARLMRVDVGTAAIASAANIGGVAGTTLVAAHHDEQLVPAGVLMALVGYAIGNYVGYFTAVICRALS